MKKQLLTIQRNIDIFIQSQSFINQVLILLLTITLTIFITIALSSFIKSKKSWFYRFTQTEILADMFVQSISFFIKILGFVVILYLLGAESIIGLILGTAGVVGLAIGFAFKDIIENYIAGILLSLRQPFKKADHILVADHEGVVQRMTTRITMIKSFDGNNISIPNSQIFKSSIVNFSTIPERRFKFSIGINPDTNPNFAREVGLRALKDLEGVLRDPIPLALIDSIGDSSIKIDFYGWVNQNEFDFFQVRSLSIDLVKKTIEENGIEIPDPSYIIKIKNTPDQLDTKNSASSVKENSPHGMPVEASEVDDLISPKLLQKDVASKQIEKENKGEGLLNQRKPE